LLTADINRFGRRVGTSLTPGSQAVQCKLPLQALASWSVISALARVNRKCLTSVSGLPDMLTAQRPGELHLLHRNPLKDPGWSDVMTSDKISGRGSNRARDRPSRRSRRHRQAADKRQLRALKERLSGDIVPDTGLTRVGQC
jgi:hypothetical protein